MHFSNKQPALPSIVSNTFIHYLSPTSEKRRPTHHPRVQPEQSTPVSGVTSRLPRNAAMGCLPSDKNQANGDTVATGELSVRVGFIRKVRFRPHDPVAFLRASGTVEGEN